MNQELIKGLGLKHDIQMFDPKDAGHAGHQDVAIVDSLVEYYNMTRVENNNDQRGVFNFARVCLDNLNNVLALATKKHGCSERGVAARVEGCKKDRGCRSLIRLGVQRMELYDSRNLNEALVRFRRGIRSDRLKPEWETFAAEYWLDEDVRAVRRLYSQWSFSSIIDQIKKSGFLVTSCTCFDSKTRPIFKRKSSVGKPESLES